MTGTPTGHYCDCAEMWMDMGKRKQRRIVVREWAGGRHDCGYVKRRNLAVDAAIAESSGVEAGLKAMAGWEDAG